MGQLLESVVNGTVIGISWKWDSYWNQLDMGQLMAGPIFSPQTRKVNKTRAGKPEPVGAGCFWFLRAGAP